mmetsp:Transcript_24352/g.76414  ORF Transcript_24352/g.76414 Transcript_24352/m.76414 type:complete len:313 (-) Transcript_24352:383-1321(-)
MGSGNAGRAIGAGYVLGMLIVPFREWTPAEPAQAAVRASSSTESAGTVRNPPGGPSGAESACAASLRRLTRRERKQKRLHAHTIAADLGAVGVGGGSSGAHPGVILTPEHHESCYRSLGHLPPLVTAQGARPGRTGRAGARGASAWLAQRDDPVHGRFEHGRLGLPLCDSAARARLRALDHPLGWARELQRDAPAVGRDDAGAPRAAALLRLLLVPRQPSGVGAVEARNEKGSAGRHGQHAQGVHFLGHSVGGGSRPPPPRAERALPRRGRGPARRLVCASPVIPNGLAGRAHHAQRGSVRLAQLRLRLLQP